MVDRIRVIAFGMHEVEIHAAETILTEDGARLPPQATESFVVGDADAKQIEKLQQSGLIVQQVGVVDMQGKPSLRAAETAGAGVLIGERLRATHFTTFTRKIEESIDLNRTNVFLIGFAGPLLQGQIEILAKEGVKLLEGYSHNQYSAVLTPDQADAVRALPFIVSVLLYGAAQTAPGGQGGIAPLGSGDEKDDSLITLDVRTHRAEDTAAVVDWLKSEKVEVIGVAGRKVRILIEANSPMIAPLANRPEVQSYEQYVPPELFNDRARSLLRVNSLPTNPHALEGNGEIVAVADTGLDDTHPDFAGRIAKLIARGRYGKTDDPHGHGTHVTGSVLGAGQSSSGAFKGVAPQATLVFQALLDNGGRLGGLPLDLGDLFKEAYAEGARIHNNSWGSATQSTYTMNANEVDVFASSQRDMLIVFAAGNEGQAANRTNSAVGVVDWLSIGAPATAKNALTVGASRSDRKSGGLSGRRWGQAWAQNFPDPPIANETVSGDPECLAAFSSRGPSDDRRIKPDVVAPGTDILSTCSSTAPPTQYWAAHSNSRYAFMGGTSMATPLVAGCAALVREYYRRIRQHEPSAALIKATLINGTRWLTGSDSNASNQPGSTPLANFDQGFGCVDLAASLPAGNDAPARKLAFVDDWRNPAFNASGERRRYQVKVQAGAPLRFCLTYHDAPGRSLQNNLNLFVQAPDGKKFIGNDKLRGSLGIPDVDNNVEIIRIPELVAGVYLIQVTVANLLHGPQDFALVVTGALGADKLVPV